MQLDCVIYCAIGRHYSQAHEDPIARSPAELMALINWRALLLISCPDESLKSLDFFQPFLWAPEIRYSLIAAAAAAAADNKTNKPPYAIA